jgi:hypothetical protein
MPEREICSAGCRRKKMFRGRWARDDVVDSMDSRKVAPRLGPGFT